MTTPSGPRPDGLAEAEVFLRRPLRVVAPVGGGEDARVYRIRSRMPHGSSAPEGDRILRVSYEPRTPQEVEWVSRWVDHVSISVPQAVRRERRQGRSSFGTAGGGTATILPFVEGTRPRRRDPEILMQAARILAGIHRAGLGWAPGNPLPRGPRRVTTPVRLVDEGLDEAWARAEAGGLVTGPVHGDFYPGNLLEREGTVVAVLDFDEARFQPLLLETAGAVFEFARDRAHRLDPSLATRFVSEYRAAGGPLPHGEIPLLGLAMRAWIRRDVQVSLAYDPSGGAYVELQTRAFRELDDRPPWLDALS